MCKGNTIIVNVDNAMVGMDTTCGMDCISMAHSITIELHLLHSVRTYGGNSFKFVIIILRCYVC